MLAFTIPAQAITIEELTSQPQFKQVSQFVSDIPNVDERGASYIDVNTVKSNRFWAAYLYNQGDGI